MEEIGGPDLSPYSPAYKPAVQYRVDVLEAVSVQELERNQHTKKYMPFYFF